MTTLNRHITSIFEAARHGTSPDDDDLDALPQSLADEVRGAAARIVGFAGTDRAAATDEARTSRHEIDELIATQGLDINAKVTLRNAGDPRELARAIATGARSGQENPRTLAAQVRRR